VIRELQIERLNTSLPKAAVSELNEGLSSELISGGAPFQGKKKQGCKRVDVAKEEITVELFELMVPIPITVRENHVRVLSKNELKNFLR